METSRQMTPTRAYLADTFSPLQNRRLRRFPGLARPSRLLVSLFYLLAAAGCASYGERVPSVPLPEAQPGQVRADGVNLVARAYLDPKEAKVAFGFDARGAGLLPVQVVMDNQGANEVCVEPEQTFLIDPQGQAWPLLTAEQAYQRTKGHLEVGQAAKGTAKPAVFLGAAGALAGFAVGILTGQNIGEAVGKGAVLGATAGALAGGASSYVALGEKVRSDLAGRSLQNRTVQPGELAYGFLFFPGKDEAKAVQSLRLTLRIGEERRLVHLPLLEAEGEPPRP